MFDPKRPPRQHRKGESHGHRQKRAQTFPRGAILLDHRHCGRHAARYGDPRCCTEARAIVQARCRGPGTIASTGLAVDTIAVIGVAVEALTATGLAVDTLAVIGVAVEALTAVGFAANTLTSDAFTVVSFACGAVAAFTAIGFAASTLTSDAFTAIGFAASTLTSDAFTIVGFASGAVAAGALHVATIGIATDALAIIRFPSLATDHAATTFGHPTGPVETESVGDPFGSKPVAVVCTLPVQSVRSPRAVDATRPPNADRAVGIPASHAEHQTNVTENQSNGAEHEINRAERRTDGTKHAAEHASKHETKHATGYTEYQTDGVGHKTNHSDHQAHHAADTEDHNQPACDSTGPVRSGRDSPADPRPASKHTVATGSRRKARSVQSCQSARHNDRPAAAGFADFATPAPVDRRPQSRPSTARSRRSGFPAVSAATAARHAFAGQCGSSVGRSRAKTARDALAG